jgi:hypothetical protein
MIPSLLMIRVGRGGQIPIILPLFLFWPFLAIGVLVLGPAVLVTSGSSRVGRRMRSGWLTMRALAQLSGLRIDVAEHAGGRVHIRFI